MRQRMLEVVNHVDKVGAASLWGLPLSRGCWDPAAAHTQPNRNPGCRGLLGHLERRRGLAMGGARLPVEPSAR